MKRLGLCLVCLLPLGMDGNCNGGMPPSGQVLSEDTDGDGLSDSLETILGTDPQLVDTDFDGLSDGDEVNDHGTDPLNRDTDGDGLTDGDEVLLHGTDPLDPDTDHDGLDDGLELDPSFLSDPLNPDTDGDGFLDGEEIALGLDLLKFNPIGFVSEDLCRDFIVVSTANAIGVYGINPFSPFLHFPSGFVPGDTVALLSEGIPGDRTGPVRANLRTLETGFFFWKGEQETGGIIVGAVPTTFSIIVILDNGLTFEVNALDLSETDDWRIGDAVRIIGLRDPPVGCRKMLNLEVCESVLLTDCE